MKENEPFKWDDLSDQPHIIRDKPFKKLLARSVWIHHVKTFCVFVLVFPWVLCTSLFIKPKKKKQTKNFFGLCVNLNRLPNDTIDYINDLNARNLSVRIPLNDIDNIHKYAEFCRLLGDRDFHFVILQDRANVLDVTLLEKNLTIIFTQLSPFSNSFQIGNAANRVKWAFASVEESLQFFKTAQKIRDEKFPNLQLSGSNIIDFEPVSFIRSVFHCYPIYFDQVASLLYVDRRGAPENKQLKWFDTTRKIAFQYAALRLSSRTSNRMIISEVNWPIINRDGYAPAKGACCVNEEAAAQYLVRFYILAMQTGQIEAVYWHQLIAPGYGLIDHCVDVTNTDTGQTTPRKMPAYFAFKAMLRFLQGTQLDAFEVINGVYHAVFKHSNTGESAELPVHVYWSLSERPCEPIAVHKNFYDIFGNKLECAPTKSGPAVAYCTN